MDYFEKQFVESTDQFIAGVDEVGRGPLAGPVVSCSVLVEALSKRIHLDELIVALTSFGITDSKKISTKRRLSILSEIGVDINSVSKNRRYLLKTFKELKVYFSVSEISESCIDEINILNASMKAMRDAFLKSYNKSKLRGTLLVDGNRFTYDLGDRVRVNTVVKGDSLSLVIGLASIIAKEYRDNLMNVYDKEFPEYEFKSHAGYPTKKHLLAIKKHGVTKIHRKTFKGVKEYLI